MHNPMTALRETCALETPDPILNEAFRYAKDNIARCMRWYTLGWGMSNCPHSSTLVVGRDTGWMCVGTDYVAPWFAPEALSIFCERQKPNGQMLEYVCMETDVREDYGLNVADNTPLLLWAIAHHWHQFADAEFKARFLPYVQRAADYLLGEIGPYGLLVTVPAGVNVHGISSWRNIIPDGVIAGEVAEINALTADALADAAELTGNAGYREASAQIWDALETRFWHGNGYYLNRFEGVANPQYTGDAVHVIRSAQCCPERRKIVLERLSEPDFWTERGMRTVPNSDPDYHPSKAAGLLGGSWPNLTLWYAAAVAQMDPNRALDALLRVARPVVEPPKDANVLPGEFAEFFDGDTGVNLGMHLSPWVAPTFIWATLEGLLGLEWKQGRPHFQPNWPDDWHEVRLRNLPCAEGRVNITLRREEKAA
jgi:glycogen debranching enzyme